ncbi:S41 family peptidase [Chitinophaga pinensis]|uniref:Peptidase S41 n=1 Tax=Chitinophaga pinensis (strain ATCC 43595 / DSM 2588 / LMG 13176 / NBRC 15968 / NCIMB 11800 / UQM 2034) TaxID=485918 RepID=A0A979GAG4_CHIPD|nr:S41 family peptidase [Chitinophaga pinensis]ACU63763.1 peptidase S41 [Chitinophaga pinensis DSM 2588]
MKKCISTFVVCCFIVLNISAQNTSCNCLSNLDTVISNTSANYAGFPDKTSGNKTTAYHNMVNALHKRANGITDPVTCFAIIKDYVAWFKDRHFDFSYATDSTQWRLSTFNEAQLRKSLLKKRQPLEGIWTNPDSTLQIAIRQTPSGNYEGIVIKSLDKKIPVGLVYCTINKTTRGYSYEKYNYLTMDYPAQLQGGVLRLWNAELWGKVYPKEMNATEQTELATWKNYNFGLDFKQLDQQTAYLKIPTFSRDNLVQKLISDNDSIIRHTKYLIVDLRNNGGGNTGWAYLLPYLMTQPIGQGNNYLRLSPKNTQRVLAEIKPLVENPIQDELKKYYTPSLVQQYQQIYKEMPLAKTAFYTIPSVTIPLDSITPHPVLIALVFDELCGSSTEYFFQVSKQSKKIIRYGTSTLGMMDYAGMPQSTPLPFKGYYLAIPDTKSSWTDTAPIDATGLQPEKDLSKIPQTEWVDFIRRDLKQY